jgi:hypothetical protein
MHRPVSSLIGKALDDLRTVQVTFIVFIVIDHKTPPTVFRFFMIKSI